VIAHAPDRETAMNKLSFALRNFVAQGPVTNREFLLDVLDNHDFRSGRAHTGFRLPTRVKEKSEEEERICATVVAAYVEHNEHEQRRVLPSIPARFRNNPYSSPPIKFEIRGREFQASAAGPEARVLAVRTNEVDVLVGGVRHCFQVCRHGDDYYVHSALTQQRVTRLPRFPRRAGSHSQETANSPMPGQVLRILVTEGQAVKPGDSLIALEAMKMEQTIKAAAVGVVKAILVKPGDMVAPGQMLVEIQSTEDAHEHSHSSAANP
jgi:propionyl-CoA carboxylase alpha chain